MSFEDLVSPLSLSPPLSLSLSDGSQNDGTISLASENWTRVLLPKTPPGTLFIPAELRGRWLCHPFPLSHRRQKPWKPRS